MRLVSRLPSRTDYEATVSMAELGGLQASWAHWPFVVISLGYSGVNRIGYRVVGDKTAGWRRPGRMEGGRREEVEMEGGG